MTYPLLNVLLLLEGFLQLGLEVTDLSQVLGRLEPHKHRREVKSVNTVIKNIE